MLRKSLLVATVVLVATAMEASAQDMAPNRSGFTLLLNTGVGFQHDAFFGETETGVAGINLGIGGFLSPNMALMFRASGTNVKYFDIWQTSGTGGASLQYWVNDKLHIEGGVGAGFWDFDDAHESALGLILAAGYSIWNNAGHNLYVGLEYAPAFTDPDTIHNFGIVFGWQLL